MNKGTDRIGQVLLLLTGGALIFGGGSCVIGIGANVFALVGLPLLGLGVWIISLAMKQDANENGDGEDAGKGNT